MSEIGEQWSPKTAPARTAPKAGTSSSASPTEVMSVPAIGSRMPKLPHEVPVEKAIAPAITNIAGTSQTAAIPDSSMRPARYSPVPSDSIRAPSIQASSRIHTAGSIERTPLTRPWRSTPPWNSSSEPV